MQEWHDDEVIGVGSKDVDIRDGDRVLALLTRLRPECVLLLAAYTDVDGCEDNPSLARAVNCDGAENVARGAQQCGSRLIFISTDYVFSGTRDGPYEVDDWPAPLNVYGRTKADAETRLQALLPDVCIVRTSWLFGVDGKCFPNTILNRVSAAQEVRVVTDQRGCPTFNRDLAPALVQLAHSDATGIIHITNSDQCSWYEFAEYLLEATGAHSSALQPVLTRDFVRSARRPRYSVLSPTSAHGHGIVLQDWRSATQAYIAERTGRLSSHAGALSPRG
ncbi:MAG: dTDP-4-dehydrorhamnose reductase [Verrucomicrobiales bacterium]|nr:dTDP-4-dehydrorhamnose reductase [Verrucomicrobiales bacterium]